MLLLGQLLLAQGVQHVELTGEVGEALGKRGCPKIRFLKKMKQPIAIQHKN